MTYAKSNKLHIVAVTAVIRNADGKFLVLKRSEREIAHPGKYTFPGGKVEDNQSVEEALVDEVAEETGMVMKPGKILLKDAAFLRPDGQTVKVFSFLCEVENSNNVTISEDFTDHAWVNLEELRNLPHVGIETEVIQAEKVLELPEGQRSALATMSQRDN